MDNNNNNIDDLRDLAPESWHCVDCTINTAPGLLHFDDRVHPVADGRSRSGEAKMKRKIKEKSMLDDLIIAVTRPCSHGVRNIRLSYKHMKEPREFVVTLFDVIETGAKMYSELTGRDEHDVRKDIMRSLRKEADQAA
jgi:hypothetical protein